MPEDWIPGTCDNCAMAPGEVIGPFGVCCACSIGQGAAPEDCTCGPDQDEGVGPAVADPTTPERENTGPVITPTVAAHVLFHFGAGGMEAGHFTRLLIELIAWADPSNRAKLAAGHPAYVAAVEKAQMTETGVAELVMIAQEAGLAGGEGS